MPGRRPQAIRSSSRGSPSRTPWDGRSRGALVVVEPGEYREQVSLRDNIRVVSRVPRGATIRLPIAASEADAAVIAERLSGAEFVGFRIVGDAATPLGTGLRVRDAALSIVDVEIVGATKAAIEFSGIGGALIGSEVHDNAGAAMVIRAGASPRISHNTFARNGMSERADAPFAIESGGRPLFQWNVFSGIGPEAFLALGEDARLTLSQHNWFPGLHAPRSPAPPVTRRPPASGSMMGTVFKRIGAYEIHDEIGRGGMASVLLATDTRTSQPGRSEAGLDSRSARRSGRGEVGRRAAGTVLPHQLVRPPGVRARIIGQLFLCRHGVSGRRGLVRRDSPWPARARACGRPLPWSCVVSSRTRVASPESPMAARFNTFFMAT